MGKGTVKIHGREYKTVALRVSEFRDLCPVQEGWSLLTEIVTLDDDKVVMKAMISNPDCKIVGMGHAEEYRTASKINRTSALENAETSAIGRALASVGLGGEEYASADEVLRALEQQGADAPKTLPKPEDGVHPPEDEKMDSSAGEKGQTSTLKQLLDDLVSKLGKEDALAWHKRVIKNFYAADSLEDLTSQQAEEYAGHIKTKIEQSKESE